MSHHRVLVCELQMRPQSVRALMWSNGSTPAFGSTESPAYAQVVLLRLGSGVSSASRTWNIWVSVNHRCSPRWSWDGDQLVNFNDLSLPQMSAEHSSALTHFLELRRCGTNQPAEMTSKWSGVAHCLPIFFWDILKHKSLQDLLLYNISVNYFLMFMAWALKSSSILSDSWIPATARVTHGWCPGCLQSTNPSHCHLNRNDKVENLKWSNWSVNFKPIEFNKSVNWTVAAEFTFLCCLNRFEDISCQLPLSAVCINQLFWLSLGRICAILLQSWGLLSLSKLGFMDQPSSEHFIQHIQTEQVSKDTSSSSPWFWVSR